VKGEGVKSEKEARKKRCSDEGMEEGTR